MKTLILVLCTGILCSTSLHSQEDALPKVEDLQAKLKDDPENRFALYNLGLVLYLGLGWMAAVVGWEVFTTLPLAAVALIVAGGGIYTSGVIFYLWDRLPYHMAIWHVFVLTGSLAIYGGMTISVLA